MLENLFCFSLPDYGVAIRDRSSLILFEYEVIVKSCARNLNTSQLADIGPLDCLVFYSVSVMNNLLRREIRKNNRITIFLVRYVIGRN